MLITKTSFISGITRTIDLDITKEQLDLYRDKGVLVQDAFPNLSVNEREFLISGIWGNEWDSLFPSEE